MKSFLMVLPLLSLLSACGALVSAASALQPVPGALAAASAAGDLVVATAVDEPMDYAEVTGRDSGGAFELRLAWTAVPRTFISRLSAVEINGADVFGDSTAIDSLRAELLAAARDPRNASHEQAISDVAAELNHAG